MQPLNLPSYQFKIKSNENKYVIFDIIRKKYVHLTPEEWVRQHIIHFLIEEKKYPISLINVEKKVLVNGTIKRTDILIFNSNGVPQLIVECIAPQVTITQEAFDQIARYNLSLKATYLMVTNGITHFNCIMDFENSNYIF